MDGPAREWADGRKEWYLNGKLHREDGPAIERPNGSKAWYIEGKELTEEEFNNRSTCTTDSGGIKEWRNKEGQLHRIGGPAIEWSDGTKKWFLNGEYHRIGGPAIEHPDGYKEWYIEGKKLTEEEFNSHFYCTIDSDGNKRWRNKEGRLHREDGPAVELSDGYKAWFLEGQRHRTNVKLFFS